MHTLKTALNSIVGHVVDQIGLLVWPDMRAPEQTDIRLYLELRRPGESAIGVVFGTAPDGQTPQLEFGQIRVGKPISELSHCCDQWAAESYWDSQASISAELFLATTGEACEFSAYLGLTIIRAFVICFTNTETPTGVVLDFENGKRLYSLPGAYGNMVTTEMTDEHWPDPIEFRDVS